MATQPFGGGGFGDALEENRQLGFESHLNSFLSKGRQASQGGRQSGGAGRSRQRALRNQFSSIQADFLGKLGNQVRSGESPNYRFADGPNSHLGQFDFEDRYQSLSPFQKYGRSSSVYNPRVRQLLKF